jgi:rSAM/selenodomain-associated transferase 1
MARAPRVGHAVKTRLAPILPDPADRVTLYAAFLADILRVVRSLEDAACRVAYTPGSDPSCFEPFGVTRDELLPQRGDDLTTRLPALFTDLFAAGFDRVVVTGSDMPGLPTSHLVEAFERLVTDEREVVLGPAEDGGYGLIGLSRAALDTGGSVPDLFSGMPWSTAAVFHRTVAAARAAGLHVHALPVWFDVDDGDGWARLQSALSDPWFAARAPATARFVAAFARRGVETFDSGVLSE